MLQKFRSEFKLTRKKRDAFMSLVQSALSNSKYNLMFTDETNEFGKFGCNLNKSFKASKISKSLCIMYTKR